jgi:hypothetical protein
MMSSHRFIAKIPPITALNRPQTMRIRLAKPENCPRKITPNVV